MNVEPRQDYLRVALQDHPKLREILESRREAVEACNHWRSIDSPEARARLTEFKALVADLDREIDRAIHSLTSTTGPLAPDHAGDGS